MLPSEMLSMFPQCLISLLSGKSTIEQMPNEEKEYIKSEYELVMKKESSLSRAQRDRVVCLYELIIRKESQS